MAVHVLDVHGNHVKILQGEKLYMKHIHYNSIVQEVVELCITSNCVLGNDVRDAINSAALKEQSQTGKEVLSIIKKNILEAEEKQIPVCQDTGMAVVFVDIGQDVHVTGGSIEKAINEGVRMGYSQGYLRKSVVKDPIYRENTGDNTPAVIHYNIVEGESLKIILAPKGFGSENMSAVKMLKPSDGIEGVKQFVVDTVDKAGPNPCPPIIVGVGIGGTMEKAAILAKHALLRDAGEKSIVDYISTLEDELLEEINKLGIGPAGLGGAITALAVNVEVFPTHIAGLPVAVNINCHASRHSQVIL